ncbi:hypothetical protein ACFGVR_15415 [Mucilaginibacter sp. AW1-3]
MLIFQLPLIFILFAIFLQDIKSRSVYWFWFPLLSVLFVLSNYFLKHLTWTELSGNIALNLLFIGLQLFLVTVYFSVKHSRWVNISKDLLGLGDMLFLIAIAFYLSILNYIVFYISSLVIIVLCWSVIRLLSKKNQQQIPLAGLQAILFMVFLIAQRWSDQIDLTSDNWLLPSLYP